MDDGLFLPPERALHLHDAAAARTAEQAVRQRRTFFRYLGWGAISVFASQLAIGLPSFLQPKRLGSFGSTVVAGTVDQLQVGDVVPIPAGKFYLSRLPEGFVALWWKCPHLGCTVQWLAREPVEDADRGFAQQGHFKCPCHSSQYSRNGQIVRGPAPRPMDRFPLRIDEQGRILVFTGPDQAISRDRALAADATAG